MAEAIDPQATVEYQVPPEHIQRAGADTALPPHPPGYRWRRGRNWFFLGLLYAAYYLCRYNLGIVAPEITKEFGFDEKWGAKTVLSRSLRPLERPARRELVLLIFVGRRRRRITAIAAEVVVAFATQAGLTEI